MREASADKAYSGAANLEAIEGLGAVPCVAFNENVTGAVGGVFAKAVHNYRFKRDVFLAHHDKRSKRGIDVLDDVGEVQGRDPKPDGCGHAE